MRTNFIALLILLSVVSTATGGDDYYEALKAYKKADYATALRLVRPLADQGNARAQILLGGTTKRCRGA